MNAQHHGAGRPSLDRTKKTWNTFAKWKTDIGARERSHSP